MKCCNPDSYKAEFINGNVKNVPVNKTKNFTPRYKQGGGGFFENEEELGDFHPNPSTKDNSYYFNIEEFNIF